MARVRAAHAVRSILLAAACLVGAHGVARAGEIQVDLPAGWQSHALDGAASEGPRLTTSQEKVIDHAILPGRGYGLLTRVHVDADVTRQFALDTLAAYVATMKARGHVILEQHTAQLGPLGGYRISSRATVESSSVRTDVWLLFSPRDVISVTVAAPDDADTPAMSRATTYTAGIHFPPDLLPNAVAVDPDFDVAQTRQYWLAHYGVPAAMCLALIGVAVFAWRQHLGARDEPSGQP